MLARLYWLKANKRNLHGQNCAKTINLQKYNFQQVQKSVTEQQIVDKYHGDSYSNALIKQRFYVLPNNKQHRFDVRNVRLPSVQEHGVELN